MKLTAEECIAIDDVISTLHHKLALAKTCSAYYKGTNKKTVQKLVLQINALYKIFDVNYKASE